MSRVPGAVQHKPCGAAPLPGSRFKCSGGMLPNVASATVPTHNRRHAHRHSRSRSSSTLSPPPLWPLYCHRKCTALHNSIQIAWLDVNVRARILHVQRQAFPVCCMPSLVYFTCIAAVQRIQKNNANKEMAANYFVLFVNIKELKVSTNHLWAFKKVHTLARTQPARSLTGLQCGQTESNRNGKGVKYNMAQTIFIMKNPQSKPLKNVKYLFSLKLL